MPMNVTPVPALGERINHIRLLTARIVNEEILPFERLLTGRADQGSGPSAEEVRQRLRVRVTEAGLWAPHLPPEYGGAGLSFLEHAYMNEILAYSPIAARFFGVVAPNSGNQQILLRYGTAEQKRRWLVPLTEGRLESGFSMTEPEVAGSDPRAIRTTARRDGDFWVINGHKWFTSNGKRADFLIVMCRTEDAGGPSERNGRMTQIIVPTDTPGVKIVRGIEVWGRESDHCEILYEDVRVPVENQLGGVGSGHEAAQVRLGAGRVYHCMNAVGHMWRAFDLMVERTTLREVHGGLLETRQFVQGFIADSYIDIQAARLMTIACAEKMDAGGDARTEISAIKVFVPAAFERVVDRAIQVWGAAGVSGDLPFWAMAQGARTLRLADGPDEVHRILIAKNVLAGAHAGQGWNFG